MENYEKVNILLVDDNPANLLAQEAVLAELGQNLVCVNSGKEALKHLLEKDFAVILLDVSMPEMDGFELAELIRHRPSSAHIPIIFITALAMTEIEREKGCSLGAVDYIFSPVSPEILRAKVSVFVDMFRMQREVKRHAEELTELDRTLEKHLEDVERLNQQLESANKELESFSYSVSHDLRNPLTVISLSSQMLMIGYADKLDEKGRDCVSRIQKATQRMTELIEALLALSRLKQQEIKSESVDLSTVTDAIARELK
ncbi:MAG: response regulator [bacterium]